MIGFKTGGKKGEWKNSFRMIFVSKFHFFISLCIAKRAELKSVQKVKNTKGARFSCHIMQAIITLLATFS